MYVTCFEAPRQQDIVLLLLFPNYSSNKSAVVLTWQRVVELVLVAPIIENSIFFLLGYIARKISKNSWFLCLMAAMYVCLFVFMHYLGMGWLGLVTLPFALVLCYCACGLIWNERGKRWAFFRVTAIHSLLNGTICIARFFIGV